MTLQETKEYTKWLLIWFFIALISIDIINAAYNHSMFGRDDSDESLHEGSNRSGLVIRTDYKTGCQFYESRNGTLTPRFDGNFNQLGCK